jgi:hypothetical protein
VRWFTTGLEIAGALSALAGGFLVAGFGGLLIAASVLLIGTSYVLSRGGSA